MRRRLGTTNGRRTDTSRYERYQSDPVAFGREVLREQYTDDIQRVMESVRDYPVTIARSANAIGKTHGAARTAVWFYKVFPEAQVYTTAAPPEGNLKRLLWGEIGAVVSRAPGLFAGDTVGILNIARNSKEFITGVAIPASGTPEQREAKFSGKHAPNIYFIVDEGDAVPDEVYKGIESCMSGGHARLLIMLNPRSSSGAIPRMEHEKQANVVELSAFTHPNVVTGRDIFPGAVTRDTTVRRINQWSRPLAQGELRTAECFEVPDFLVGCTALSKSGQPYAPLQAGVRKVTSPALSYMTLGLYPGQAENQLFSQEWLDAARSRWDLWVAQKGEVPPEGVQPVLGLDIAEFGVDHNVLCARYGGWIPRLRKWQGMDPVATGHRAAEVHKELNARVAQVDGTGVGAGTAPTMNNDDAFAISVKVASSPTYKTELGEFGILRDQLYWTAREWLANDPSAMLPPDEELLEELKVPTYSIQKGKIKIMDKDTMKEILKRSPDSMESFILTHSPEGVQAWL